MSLVLRDTIVFAIRTRCCGLRECVPLCLEITLLRLYLYGDFISRVSRRYLEGAKRPVPRERARFSFFALFFCSDNFVQGCDGVCFFLSALSTVPTPTVYSTTVPTVPTVPCARSGVEGLQALLESASVIL